MASPEVPAHMNSPIIPLEGDQAKFKLSVEAQKALALLPFQGKTLPSLGERKKAIILWGPPGSGKSTLGQQLIQARTDKENFVTVCYDEFGALQSIPDYTRLNDPLVKAHDRILAAHAPTMQAELQQVFDRRLALYNSYRDDSQRIRSFIFNEALARGNNLLIDITASGKGTAEMIQKLKAQGYEIEVDGMLASADNVTPRINERSTKVVTPEEVYSKRVGCYESLPSLIDSADIFRLFLNDVQQQKPLIAMESKNVGMAKPVIAFNSQEHKDLFFGIMEKDQQHFAKNPQLRIQHQQERLTAAVEAIKEKVRDIAVVRAISKNGSTLQK